MGVGTGGVICSLGKKFGSKGGVLRESSISTRLSVAKPESTSKFVIPFLMFEAIPDNLKSRGASR
ncbi:hypothetical protein D3C83_162840 [compost metagenome]